MPLQLVKGIRKSAVTEHKHLDRLSSFWFTLEAVQLINIPKCSLQPGLHCSLYDRVINITSNSLVRQSANRMW
jgi:hypothetical protein